MIRKSVVLSVPLLWEPTPHQDQKKCTVRAVGTYSTYAAYSHGKGSSAASSVARAERTTAEVLVAESGSGRADGAAATAADAA